MSIVTIAEKAGVGIGTVSRYINDRSKVSDDAARKIAMAIEEIGYHPRVRRPGPKTKGRAGIRTGVVLFLTLGDLEPEKMLHMPAFPILMTGIQKALMAHGLSPMFANYVTNDNLPEMLDEKYCDGVIILSFKLKEQPEKLLKKLQSIPTVWCFREHCDYNNEFDHVFYNNAAVGTIAARYMHEHKHRVAAYMSSSSLHEAFRQRQEVFVQHCERFGIKIDSFCSNLPENAPIGEHAALLASRFIDSRSQASGIFFCSDDAMLGVYNELRAKGFPLDDIDMLGCNNEEQFLGHIRPRPATIDIRLSEMGEQAVFRLLSRINGVENNPAMELLINPQLIPGDRQPARRT